MKIKHLKHIVKRQVTFLTVFLDSKSFDVGSGSDAIACMHLSVHTYMCVHSINTHTKQIITYSADVV